jgi:hypothetical protein
MSEKEKGAIPFESAPQGNTSADDSTVEQLRIVSRLASADRAAEVTLTATAAAINAEYALAVHHATTAIEHARRIGQLLLDVKASVHHGEFLPWLDANVEFSRRQAQRYMAAAQGKPLPMRGIAALPKNDTVSYLTLNDIPMPRFKAGEYLRAVAVVVDVWYDELLILPATDGGAFVGHINGPADGEQMSGDSTVWTWRSDSIPVEDLRSSVIVFSFPWDRAKIVERSPLHAFARSPFAGSA